MESEEKETERIEAVKKLLANTEERNEYLRGFFSDPDDDFNEIADEIVLTIQPEKDATRDEMTDYLKVIREYDEFIDLVDWNEKYENKERPDVDIDLYNHAFYGIRGYIERYILPEINP
ncbi:MAG: hypothetical protein QXU18_12275 [Thermoplasmatales archaeon]